MVYETDLGRALAVKRTAGQAIEHGIARPQEVGQRFADGTARKQAEVHLGEAEGCFFGGHRQIAPLDDRERAAEAVPVDHRDRGFRKVA